MATPAGMKIGDKTDLLGPRARGKNGKRGVDREAVAAARELGIQRVGYRGKVIEYAPKNQLGGRLTFKEKDDRVSFVATLVAKRLTYGEIAKGIADKFGMTRRAAYAFMYRLTERASQEFLANPVDLTHCFQRIIYSLEDIIKTAKAAGDLKAAVSAESALARLYGFDKGQFLAALEQQRSKAKAKKIDTIEVDTSALIRDMNALNEQQLREMLSDEDVEKVLHEDESETQTETQSRPKRKPKPKAAEVGKGKSLTNLTSSQR